MAFDIEEDGYVPQIQAEAEAIVVSHGYEDKDGKFSPVPYPRLGTYAFTRYVLALMAVTAVTEGLTGDRHASVKAAREALTPAIFDRLVARVAAAFMQLQSDHMRVREENQDAA
jgi:hypothetical protein